MQYRQVRTIHIIIIIYQFPVFDYFSLLVWKIVTPMSGAILHLTSWGLIHIIEDVFEFLMTAAHTVQLNVITQSVVATSETDDMKRRMYSCLLLVGGGFMFRGSHAWLHDLVWKQMPPHLRLSIDPSEIITPPKVELEQSMGEKKS